MSENASDVTLRLVQEALSGIDDASGRLSAVIRKAIRVARLRNDWYALYWLQLEMAPMSAKEARRRIFAEVAPHFSRDALKVLHDRARADSIGDRTLKTIDATGTVEEDESVSSLSVPEIEDLLARFTADARSTTPMSYRARSNLSFFIGQLQGVLSRISLRVHAYLSQVERQLVQGLLEADIVQQNRQYTEKRLGEFAPEVLEQLRAASQRVKDGNTESRSHALTSCRRALHSLADRVYPARKEPVIGKDGKERSLTAAMFVARLWQFIGESKANDASMELLQSEVDDLGKRIDRLNDLTSKGVHATVSEFEVNLAVLGTYSVVGAILRLRDNNSAALSNPDDLGNEK